MSGPHWGQPTSVARLRLKSRSPDQLAARLHAAALFNLLSLEPSGLPPTALLCIRSLRDPKPGAMAWQGGGLRPALAWEQAVNDSIRDLARHAARPIEAAVPADAQAVLFADRSEWLACLAQDWCSGDLTTHWWWQSLLRQRSPAGAVTDAWRQAPEHIPAALHVLAMRHQAGPFIDALGQRAAAELSLALTRTFGLHDLHGLVPGRPAQPAPPQAEKDEVPIRGTPVSPATGEPPWAAQLTEPDQRAATVAGQVLLGIALTLHRAPHVARSPKFARQMQAWLLRAPPAGPAPAAYAPARPTLSPVQKAFMGQPGAAPSLPVEPADTRPVAAAPDLGVDATATVTAAIAHSSQPGAAAQTLAQTENDGLAVTDPSELAGGLEINTAFAGCLYLINLALFLGLYGDFTTPLSPGLALPIWDFVALVARELSGPAVAADPLWRLLARLAGRTEDEAPGYDFEPPGSVSLRDWLDELIGTIRPRLSQALASEAQSLGHFMQARGRVVATTFRLDAFYALAELPIEVRLSGLDRDPGWMPAAGRTIAFHFD